MKRFRRVWVSEWMYTFMPLTKATIATKTTKENEKKKQKKQKRKIGIAVRKPWKSFNRKLGARRRTVYVYAYAYVYLYTLSVYSAYISFLTVFFCSCARLLDEYIIFTSSTDSIRAFSLEHTWIRNECVPSAALAMSPICRMYMCVYLLNFNIHACHRFYHSFPFRNSSSTSDGHTICVLAQAQAQTVSLCRCIFMASPMCSIRNAMPYVDMMHTKQDTVITCTKSSAEKWQSHLYTVEGLHAKYIQRIRASAHILNAFDMMINR